MIDIGSRTTTRLDLDRGDRHLALLLAGRLAQIVFESDRGGQQQLYVMAAGGGEGQPHLLRPGPLFAARLVAARRFHRLHPPAAAAASPSA